MACDASYPEPLSTRISLEQYSHKLATHSHTFEAWEHGQLVALVACYINTPPTGFISDVSVQAHKQGHGLAQKLIRSCVKLLHAQKKFKSIELKVSIHNEKALNLYKKLGFKSEKINETEQLMTFNLQEEKMSSHRDYNAELKDTKDHKYAYNFDFDVMHHYMLKAFTPYFKDGKFLELGSFKGDFTGRFIDIFDDISCVEASDEAINLAKSKYPNVTFYNSLFEEANLPSSYQNIIMTHVLEHVDDPVKVLKRVNDEWLADNGRFFLVCPNANAPSRQIAVKMGLISHNSAVTPAEHEHGHRCTYTLDTLERDAREAGLKVIRREGIFFKALANFQWDKLLQTDIISKEYLEGCYQLGQQYPDLCSSIMLVCEKGDS